MRVLVIDDDEDLRCELVETVKERLGARVGELEVLDGPKTEDANNHLGTGEAFDISVLDIVLLEKGSGSYGRLIDPRGYEGVAIYQAKGAKKRLGKVIFITNAATYRQIRKLWPEVEQMTVCLKDPPLDARENEDWPENLYAAIETAAGLNEPG